MTIEVQSELISIILPVYNGEKYLSQSIESCLNQTYRNIEIIIVNDASTDGTLEICNHYVRKDDRVRLISNAKNKNLPFSLNIGHKMASGNYITWTSHDNIYASNAIEVLKSALLAESSDVVFSNFKIIDTLGHEIGKYRFNSSNSILLENIVGACFLYKSQVYQRNNGYNENLYKIEDYAFWLMASNHSSFCHINEELYEYRIHSESLTSSRTKSQFSFTSEYTERVKKMYQAYFNEIGLDKPDDIAELFKDFHLHQPLSVENLLDSYKSIVRKLDIVLHKHGKIKVLKEIDIRIRQNILNYESNQNLKVLYSILSVRPSIVYSYSKIKSLKIIMKCLFHY